jgi:hypothetical protein
MRLNAKLEGRGPGRANRRRRRLLVDARWCRSCTMLASELKLLASELKLLASELKLHVAERGRSGLF